MAKDKEMNDQMIVRRQKMDELRKEGIDPFGHRFVRTYLAEQLHADFDDEDKDELMEKDKKVTIAGRMIAKRGKGKVGFADLKIEPVKFKFMSEKILSEKMSIIFSNDWILEITWEFQDKSSKPIWVN